MTTLDEQLVEAVYAKDTILCEQLIKQGANPNCRDTKTTSPHFKKMRILFYPLFNRDIPMIKLLMNYGATIGDPVGGEEDADE